MIRKIPEIK